MGSQCNGRAGESLAVEVPVGTRVYDEETDEVLADLTADGQRWVAAQGGAGGAGNIHYKTSTNRAPRQFKPGGEAVELRLRLELMLMADVGLVGFPNAGKSTLISRISSARPRVADYPFTTLVPNLGVVDMGVDGSFVVADVPGLIQGAAEGAGLGHRFLKHVQRTRLLLHLVSLGSHELEIPAVGPDGIASPGGADPVHVTVARYRAIRSELEAFDPDLAGRPELVVLTKSDLVDADALDAARRALCREVPADRVLAISAVTGQGVSGLVHRTWQELLAMLSV